MKRTKIATVDRLLNIKRTIFEAQKYLLDIDDSHHMAIGLSLLHDSIESLFSLINENFGQLYQDNTDFISKYDCLKRIDSLEKKITISRLELCNLNKMRANYKHHGILPDSKQSQKIAESILDSIRYTIKEVLEIDIETMSSSSLIEDEELKEAIQKLEGYCLSSSTIDDYKKNLEEMGKIFFDFYERNFIVSAFQTLPSEKKRYRFFEEDSNKLDLSLLELGITPFYYYRFKNFVPTYGVDSENNNSIISKKNVLYWNKKNWNKKNENFCLNWLINFFLRRQWVFSREGYSLNSCSTFDIIKTVEDTPVLATYRSGLKRIEKTVVLKKNVEYLGATDYKDGQWQDFEAMNQEKDTYVLLANKNWEYLTFYIKRNLLSVSSVDEEEISEETRDEYDKKLAKLFI